jgi:hypothetical protein
MHGTISTALADAQTQAIRFDGTSNLGGVSLEKREQRFDDVCKQTEHVASHAIATGPALEAHTHRSVVGSSHY